VSDALFAPDGPDGFLPGPRARGPWDIRSLHGGPVAALLARLVEGLPADGPLHLARLTVELLRPAPVTRLRATSTVLRPGRKVQLGGASLFVDDTEVARAVGLRIRPAEVDMPALPEDAAGGVAPALPSERAMQDRKDDYEAFHNQGVEMRYAKGFFLERGPATVWMRLCQPVVAGEEPSPCQRAIAVADFGNGVSSILSWDEFVFINPELTVHLVRPPVGEWVCLDSRTVVPQGSGIGLAESALYDQTGRIGRSTQALLVDRRG
jgi:hypothetical protein